MPSEEPIISVSINSKCMLECIAMTNSRAVARTLIGGGGGGCIFIYSGSAQLTSFEIDFITPPARRAWRSYKFAPFLVFFSVSKVGTPLMGDTAVHSLSHDFKLNF